MRIENYALIGDCETAALVSNSQVPSTGCAGHVFDSGACFASLLGTPDNGRWLIAPQEQETRVTRRYLTDTLILETVFETPTGVVSLIDFMPPEVPLPDIISHRAGGGQGPDAYGVRSPVRLRLSHPLR